MQDGTIERMKKVPKKSQKYNDIVRVIAEMEAKKQAEKDRIGTMMMAELDDDTAALLGDLSDSDLRRVMGLLLPRIGECVAQVKSAKKVWGKVRTAPTGEDAEVSDTDSEGKR